MRENAPSYIWRKRKAPKRGDRISFDQVWALFEPNDTVVLVDNLNHIQILQFVSISQRESQRKTSQDLHIVLWGVWWNSAESMFERKAWEITLESFTGTKAITSLPIYPTRYLDPQEETDLIAQLVDRGYLWRNVVRQRTSSYNYKGSAFVDRGKQSSTEKLQQTNVRIQTTIPYVTADEESS